MIKDNLINKYEIYKINISVNDEL